MIEIKFHSLQIEFCIFIQVEHSCDGEMRSVKKVPQTEGSVDTGEKNSRQEHLADLPGDPGCHTEQEGVRETDNLGTAGETEAGGEPEPSLICDRPEHDDGLVAETQWVCRPLEVGRREGWHSETAAHAGKAG